MKLVVDMDEVIVNLMEPTIEVYNDKYKTNLMLADITEWKLPKGMKELFNIPGFFLGLPPLEGAVEGMRELRSKKEGHDIIIATSPSGTPHIAQEKMLWLKFWLPEFMGGLHLCHRKDRLIGDLICDDCPEYLTNFQGARLIMDRPWNRDLIFDDDFYTNRVKSFDDIVRQVDLLTMIGIRKGELRGNCLRTGLPESG
jgi:5'-nucleotidase